MHPSARRPSAEQRPKLRRGRSEALRRRLTKRLSADWLPSSVSSSRAFPRSNDGRRAMAGHIAVEGSSPPREEIPSLPRPYFFVNCVDHDPAFDRASERKRRLATDSWRRGWRPRRQSRPAIVTLAQSRAGYGKFARDVADEAGGLASDRSNWKRSRKTRDSAARV